MRLRRGALRSAFEPMSKPNPSVDGYIRKNKPWEKELSALRELLLRTELVEEVKWRTPCYSLNGANVMMIGAFKEGCVLSFLKGALVKDPKGLLVKPGENTQAARVMRFSDAAAIAKLEKTIVNYIDQAIQIEKAGLKVQFKKVSEFAMPEEFKEKLKANPKLKAAFESLTPGRQRGYLLHFGGAKQSQTRAARVDKHTPRILAGKGLDD